MCILNSHKNLRWSALQEKVRAKSFIIGVCRVPKYDSKSNVLNDVEVGEMIFRVAIWWTWFDFEVLQNGKTKLKLIKNHCFCDVIKFIRVYTTIIEQRCKSMCLSKYLRVIKIVVVERLSQKIKSLLGEQMII